MNTKIGHYSLGTNNNDIEAFYKVPEKLNYADLVQFLGSFLTKTENAFRLKVDSVNQNFRRAFLSINTGDVTEVYELINFVKTVAGKRLTESFKKEGIKLTALQRKGCKFIEDLFNKPKSLKVINDFLLRADMIIKAYETTGNDNVYATGCLTMNLLPEVSLTVVNNRVVSKADLLPSLSYSFVR
jgi:hypothetical protein